MTEVEIKLVQSSFDKIKPIAGATAKLFYVKLFELDPWLKPLFKNNIDEQGNKLISMIGMIVNSLNDLENIVLTVADLGRKHKGYNVPNSSYATVGEALISTLAEGLEADFTEETKSAWIKVYTLLSETMLSVSNTK